MGRKRREEEMGGEKEEGGMEGRDERGAHLAILVCSSVMCLYERACVCMCAIVLAREKEKEHLLGMNEALKYNEGGQSNVHEPVIKMGLKRRKQENAPVIDITGIQLSISSTYRGVCALQYCVFVILCK